MVKHKPLAPKSYAGVRKELKYIDCSCGWKGRLTLIEQAKDEQATHARGEIMSWEIEAAHYDAILEDRRRARDE